MRQAQEGGMRTVAILFLEGCGVVIEVLGVKY
jgi:hypothetical protein